MISGGINKEQQHEMSKNNVDIDLHQPKRMSLSVNTFTFFWYNLILVICMLQPKILPLGNNKHSRDIFLYPNYFR